MDEPDGGRSPLGDAIEWVARITTIGIMMVLPGVGGLWLDRRFDTKFLGLVGFALGLALGIWTLLAMVRRPKP